MRKQKGVTLMILITTITLILILSGIIISGFNHHFLEKSQTTKNNAVIKQIQDELELDKTLALHEKALNDENHSSNLTMEEYIKYLEEKGIQPDHIKDTGNETSKKVEVDGHMFLLEENNGDIHITYDGEAKK